jgi:SAM-dependent methyltransferase
MDERHYAMGRMLLAHHRGMEAEETIERDDKYISLGSASAYFAPFKEWAPHQRKADRLVRGRVLDVGCGAGRHVLHFQRRGRNVVGIDLSPLAIKVCKERGVKDAREMSITGIGPGLGHFDTITMLGNNFGLCANYRRAKWLLKGFHRITPGNGRIIAETLDPYATTDPCHLTYQKRNRRRGRMGGQIRFRMRFREYVGQWLDYLFVSREELVDILDGTGWRLVRTIDSKAAVYIAVIEKG